MSNEKSSYNHIGWLICILGVLFYCYEYFLRIMPGVMTNDLMEAFKINATMLGNLSAFYYYAYTPMQIPVGVMMDRFGPKRLIIFAIQVCGLGVLLFGLSGHFYLACFGRFLVGFGSAFAFVGVLKLASLWLPIRFLGFISGAATTIGMVGALFGSVFLEHIVRLSGWEATIKVSILGSFVLAIIISLMMPRFSLYKKRQALLQKQETTTTSEEGPASYQALIQNLFVLAKNPLVWLNGFVGCMLYLSLSVFAELWGPKYLEVTRNLTSEQAVWASGTVFVAWAIFGPLIGYLASDSYRRNIHLLMIGSLVAMAASGFLLLSPHLSYSEIIIALFIFGAGSASEILVFAIACMIVSRRFAGSAIAFTNMVVMLGGMVFQPIVGKILDLLWYGGFSNGIKIYSPSSFNIALLILPIGTLMSFLVTLLMRYLYKEDNEPSYQIVSH